MTMTTPFEVPALAARDRSVWSRLFDTVIGSQARQIEEIVGYLERHQYDLPPEVRIGLERRLYLPMGQDSCR